MTEIKLISIPIKFKPSMLQKNDVWGYDLMNLFMRLQSLTCTVNVAHCILKHHIKISTSAKYSHFIYTAQVRPCDTFLMSLLCTLQPSLTMLLPVTCHTTGKHCTVACQFLQLPYQQQSCYIFTIK